MKLTKKEREKELGTYKQTNELIDMVLPILNEINPVQVSKYVMKRLEYQLTEEDNLLIELNNMGIQLLNDNNLFDSIEEMEAAFDNEFKDINK